MIEKILELKNIRSFLDFSSSEIEFGKKNIIYAPNGTGKTNISRVFDKLSKNKLLDELLSQEAYDTKDQSFKIKIGNDEVTKSTVSEHKTSLEKIYVFNSDYIEDTIRNKNFTEIDVSGEVNIPIGNVSNEIADLNKSINTECKLREDVKENLEALLKKFQTAKIESKEYSKSDINIWKELSIEKLIDKDFNISVPQLKTEFKDCEDSFKKLSTIDENTTINHEELLEIDLEGVDFSILLSDLKTPQHFKVFDDKIKDSIDELTKDWIETNSIQLGIELSKQKNECILCQRTLDESVNSLFDKFQTYFENEESKFKDKLKKNAANVEAIERNIKKINNGLEDEVNEYAKAFNLDKSWESLQTETLKSKFKELIASIEDKRSDLTGNHCVEDKEGDFFPFESEVQNLNKKIEQNLDLIKQIIKRFSKVKEEKTKLRTIIGAKFLNDFYTNNKSEFNKIAQSNNEIREAKAKLILEEQKLPTTKVSANIETLCNLFMEDYLYMTKYKVVEKDGVLQLKLNSHDISNTTQKISEGEKTMIALAFYLSSSIQKFNSSEKFFNGIFIIDDPVNSTSYNHFFGICNLLKFFDETIVKKLWSEEINKLPNAKIQKIILSHNTQFFNVMRTNVYKDKAKYFLLGKKSLKQLPKDYLKSEFESSLSKIKETVNSKDYEKALGNDLRRFFETIKHFYGIRAFEAETLKTIFQDFQVKKHNIFYTVVNYYSHGNPEAHTDPLPMNFEPFLVEFEELISNSQFKELWNRIEYN